MNRKINIFESVSQVNAPLPVIRRFSQYFRPYIKEIPIILGIIITSSITQTIAPLLTGWSVDNLILKGNWLGLLWMLVVLTIVYLTGFLSNRTLIVKVGVIMQHLLAQLRQDIMNKLQTLPLSFYDRSKVGDLMSRLLSDVNTLNQVFSPILPQVIGGFFGLLASAIFMLSINLQLGLITNLIVPIMLLTTAFFARLARAKFRITRETISQLSIQLEENISNIQEVQAFNRAEINIQEFKKLNADNRNANIQATAITAAFLPTIDLFNTLTWGIVLAYGGFLVSKNIMTVGAVTAFLFYVQQFFQPIQLITNFYTQAQSGLAGLERIFLLLDEPVQLEDATDASAMPAIQGKVQFESVNFGYKPGQKVLENVTFDAEAGQAIALVGATGAGKTTIISLLSRFYDVSSGAIKIDDIDIRKVTQASLRRQIGVVSQDTMIFSCSVAENIAFGNPQATTAEIEAAAKIANIHDFILTLRQGYETQLGERGINLSKGQQQLISIARAVLVNPRILILDEATSNIDSQTENLVQQAIANLLQGRTSFIIAHRLATVTNADKVLVIEQGQIIEQGTHTQLMEQRGVYANLYSLQLVNNIKTSLKIGSRD
ncbi:ABC transporter ATP-binding protein [Nostoc sp. UCD121]|uniref:ABC transporter ATP-binding protein n=1 Tax=unclassified Nostoc TaxID=2593658 RepID=UPI00162A05E2|nr:MULTISPECIES: ABC transporter ATP-binding protein [unclassified Nostoc]MBC1225318.1 ABC transporter ATP-binding protein [Nostoc sp. UCD120]MBC1276513.1 ABC transporter ATP-binding protein [Nostoc sp. UCD121]MBC1297034.1 ABC transporter ATP-binding protein [Nostoc sp. UCD122]